MNKQTKYLRKHKFCTRNSGASCTVAAIQHGKSAFMDPSKAKRALKENGGSSWKVHGNHPNNPQDRKK